MAKKPEPQYESTLGTFIVLSVESPTATVRCPHCEGWFTVDGRLWRAPLISAVSKRELNGRSCPYCMKVSLIPLGFFPKKLRAAKAALRG